MHSYPHTKKSPGKLYWAYPDVWMRGLNNFKAATQETGGKRNEGFEMNATYLKEGKEIK